MLKLILALLFILTITSCGKESKTTIVSSSNTGIIHTTTTGGTYIVNGESASVYYSHFVHREESKQYVYAYSTMRIGGDSCDTTLQLFMFPDGRYKLRILRPTWGCTSTSPMEQTSTWQVNGTQLNIGMLGVGAGIILNGNKAFTLKFQGMSEMLFGQVEGRNINFLIAYTNVKVSM